MASRNFQLHGRSCVTLTFDPMTLKM